MSTETHANVQPKAVMTPDELARWNQLPPLSSWRACGLPFNAASTAGWRM
jgi:hypothetical protein